MKTQEDVMRAYEKLCQRCGDLYFARTSLAAQLKEIDDALAAANQERALIQERRQALMKEAADASSAPAT